MKGVKNLTLIIVLAIILIVGVMGCNGYNGLVKQDEAVNLAWNNVNTEYQKRADLVDNLVNTVKGAANFERETLTAVVNARAKATSVNFTADQLTPENMAKFEQAQSEMSGALSRLLVSVERYPELKANQNFTELQYELAGTENRIATERMRYNETVESFNTSIRRFPTNIIAKIFGFEKRQYFEINSEDAEVPEVNF